MTRLAALVVAAGLAVAPRLVWAQGAPIQLIPPSANYPAQAPAAPIEQTPLAPPTTGPAPSAPAVAGQAPPASPPGSPPSSPLAGQPAPAPAQPPEWANRWVPQSAAVLRVLDKVDAVKQELTVKVGQTVAFQSLSIKVQACVVRPPDQPADAAAFLVIVDGHKDEPGFQGWSLANEPWVSMLQNPVYGVRVVGCT